MPAVPDVDAHVMNQTSAGTDARLSAVDQATAGGGAFAGGSANPVETFRRNSNTFR